jgi:F-type H+-transporting ATPase subunit delta
MLNASLSLRYARAIYRIAASLGKADKVAADLRDVSEAVEASTDLKRVLYHPGITPDEKKKVLADLFAGSMEKAALAFIGYLIDKKRIHQLASIAESVSKILDEHENKVKVTVESFGPLSGETVKKIKERLAQKLGKDIVLTAEVNPSLLGGAKLVLGDRVIDGSIAYKLKRLSETVTAI